MEIMELTEEDMQSSGGGGRKWDDEALKEDLQNAWDQLAEEDDEVKYIGISLEDMAGYYSGTLQQLKDLSHTNPDVSRKILGVLEDAGFQKESEGDRKYAVGTQTGKDGSVIFKVELRPKD